jgi:hypothetical protein
MFHDLELELLELESTWSYWAKILDYFLLDVIFIQVNMSTETARKIQKIGQCKQQQQQMES